MEFKTEFQTEMVANYHTATEEEIHGAEMHKRMCAGCTKKMEIADIVKQVEVIGIKDGDLLIVKINADQANDQFLRIFGEFHEWVMAQGFTKTRVLVCDINSVDVSVVREDDTFQIAEAEKHSLLPLT